MKIDNPIVSGSLIVSGSTIITGILSASSFIGDGSGLVGVTSYTNTDTLNYINTLGVVSGSSQISFTDIVNKPTLVSGSQQISFTGITNKPTLVSGSSQIIYSNISNIPSGIVSGSSQVDLTQTTNYVSGIKTRLNSENVVSGSVTWNTLSGKPSGIVSGSSQISALGFTTCTGTVTSVGGTGTVAGLSLSGTVTSTGNLTLGGTLSTPVSTINDSTTVGQNLVKLTNPSAIRFIRINADNTVSALSDVDFRTATGATGTVSSITTGTYLTGGIITTSGTIAVDATTTATAGKIVARDGNGDDFRRYGFADYFNMSHSTSTRNSDTIFYSSTDNYLRKNNATGMRTSLNVPTRTGGDASGTWGISITGNAATATTLQTARTINGVSFNGSANITIPAPSGLVAKLCLVEITTTATCTTIDFGTNAYAWEKVNCIMSALKPLSLFSVGQCIRTADSVFADVTVCSVSSTSITIRGMSGGTYYVPFLYET